MENYTKGDFINKANSKHNKRYSYVNVVYKNNKQKVSITCQRHGDFLQIPGNHLSGQGCPKCANNQRKSAENFIVESELVHNKVYNYHKVVYVNCDTDVKIECKIHGFFYQTPYTHLQGSGCPICVGKNKTTPVFIDEANQIHAFNYSYTKSIYKDSKTKLVITCHVHGDFVQSPSNHLAGHGCTKCGGKNRLTKNYEYTKKANLVHNFRYDYNKLNYINSKTKIIITCRIHGDIEQLPHNHLRGHGCLKCKLSKGEKTIFKVLANENMQFKTQYQFEDCIYKRKLLYDFALFFNEKITLIEFHGEQHYKSINFFGSESNFEKILIRDKIKQDYACANNIELLIIPYTETMNIESLVSNFIQKIKGAALNSFLVI